MMEREDLFSFILALETLVFPFVPGLAAVGIVSEFTVKVILVIILASMFFLAYSGTKILIFKGKRICGFMVYFLIVLTWNSLFAIYFVTNGFSLCPSCP
jgi:hypothetical protein